MAAVIPSLNRSWSNGDSAKRMLNDGIAAAISNSQAVIRFELDGTIIEANQNFLDVLGYRLEEIQGKHHSMFCEASFAQSPDYTALWTDMQQGKTRAGRFKRIAKSGAEVWIEASYNPIFNDKGEPIGVVKFAVDVTKPALKTADASGQLNALSRAMAVIEFETDGTIITANDNFLDALGYSLEEVQGQKHSMFVDPEYGRSAEYANFWDRLASGQFEAGEFERRTKAGKSIWIQATYNPILDPEGRPYKVVKFASDITPRRVATDALQVSLAALSEGNLDARIGPEVTGEFAAIREAFNGTMDYLADLVGQIRTVVDQVQSASGAIRSGAQDLSERTSAQAASLEETNASVEQITQSVKTSAGSAEAVLNAASEAAQGVDDGQTVTNDAVEAMHRIEKTSQEVGDIVKVIDSIAFQTNMLALNAAVEAARAGGTAGSGFAVVAQEVRALAQRSADAAHNIASLISSSGKAVEEGSRLVKQSGELLGEINAKTETVVSNITEITKATGAQSVEVEAVHRVIANLDEATQMNARLSIESASNAEGLAANADKLSRLLAFFKTTSKASGDRSVGLPSALKKAS